MIASLPMYWRAETAPLWRAFWEVVRAEALREAVSLPLLTAPEDLPADWGAHWLRDDLALSMTCGLPFRTRLRHRVRYVGTLDFGLGGPPGRYCSRIVARRGARGLSGPLKLAYNMGDSQSGWAAAQAPGALSLEYSETFETGSHRASVQAVAEGRADICFVDAVTWRLVSRYDDFADRVAVVGRTGFTPGLPLICALDRDAAPLQRALAAAVARFAPEDPEAMGGRLRFEVLSPDDYFAIAVPSRPD